MNEVIPRTVLRVELYERRREGERGGRVELVAGFHVMILVFLARLSRVWFGG